MRTGYESGDMRPDNRIKSHVAVVGQSHEAASNLTVEKGKMCVVVLHCCAVPASPTALFASRLNGHLALRGIQSLPRPTSTSGR